MFYGYLSEQFTLTPQALLFVLPQVMGPIPYIPKLATMAHKILTFTSVRASSMERKNVIPS